MNLLYFLCWPYCLNVYAITFLAHATTIRVSQVENYQQTIDTVISFGTTALLSLQKICYRSPPLWNLPDSKKLNTNSNQLYFSLTHITTNFCPAFLISFPSNNWQMQNWEACLIPSVKHSQQAVHEFSRCFLIFINKKLIDWSVFSAISQQRTEHKFNNEESWSSAKECWPRGTY